MNICINSNLKLTPINKYNNSINFKSNYIPNNSKPDNFEKTEAPNLEKTREVMGKINSRIKKLQDEIAGNGGYRGVYRKRETLRELEERKRECLQDSSIIQRYIYEEKTAPNTSFLYDPSLTLRERKEILEQHSEIIPCAILKRKNNDIKNYIADERFFVTKKISKTKSVIDTSDEINAENLKRLTQGEVIAFNNIEKKTGLTLDRIRSYIANGFFEQISLIDRTTQEETLVKLINTTSETSAIGFKRIEDLKSFMPTPDKHSMATENIGKKQKMVPLLYLSQLGYGTVQQITDILKDDNIPVEKIELNQADGTSKAYSAVDIGQKRTRDILLYSKNHSNNSLTLEDFAKEYKISPTEVEDALLTGKLEAIKTYIYESETPIIRINTSNKRNQKYINDLIIENAIYEILKKEENKSTNSLRKELAWHLSPLTKNAASFAFGQNSEEFTLLEKRINQTEKALENPELSEEEKNKFIDQLADLTIKLDILKRKTFNFMWKIVGTEEHTKAINSANQILQQLKESGIDSIEDEEIRQIILRHPEYSKYIS